MNDNINLYEIMNAFWRENEYEAFSSTEISFYFFLLNRSNSRHWIMPIKCQTSYASKMLNVTPARIISARTRLHERGIIEFIPGVSKRDVPLYKLILDPKKWLQKNIDGVSKEKKHLKLNDRVDYDTVCNRVVSCDNDKDCNMVDNIDSNMDSNMDSDNPYNIKDKYINIKNKKIKEEIEINRLKEIFKNDEVWLVKIYNDLHPLFPFVSPEMLKNKLEEFFTYIKSKGETKREENDCRNHFVNWISLKLKKEENGKNNNQFDPRRGNNVTATSPKDYEGRF